MKDVGIAMNLIAEAMQKKAKIMIYGDYDVDGVMSTVIIYKLLQRLGADVEYYIPHRVEEGYGLNVKAVEHIASLGVSLLITVDNGIASHEEVAVANRHNMQVVIIDHHEPGFMENESGRIDMLPLAAAIIDPKQSECSYPFKELCAAGLAYKLAGALCKYLNVPFLDQDELLVLAAIATICDIVTLQDENRILVKQGLALLNTNKLINPGLGSLITRRGYLDKPADAFTIGYILGPCLNATGRLESATLSVELLLSEFPSQRIQLAHELADLNDERKKLTADCVDRALNELPTDNLDKVLVLTDPTAHESVAGIVAGRIREATGRPTILLTQGEGAMKGSGRSIEGYNLFEALFAHKDLFLRFGGHAMAAGLTMQEENVPVLRAALNADCA